MIHIDYHEKSNRFIITAPYLYLGEIKKIPSRKWDPKRKVWTAPAVRQNAEYIEKELKNVHLTEAAKDALGKARDSVYRPVREFPESYVHKTQPFQCQSDALPLAYPQSVFALFMETGSGKTKVAIDLASARHQQGLVDSALVVAPKSALSSWAEMVDTHSPLSTIKQTLDLSIKKSKPVGIQGQMGWYFVAIESLMGSQRAIDWAESVFDVNDKTMMIIDESSKIKNPSANRTKTCIKLGKSAKYRLIMTGTEVTQGILDLYSQFEFLDPAIIGIGDWYSFRNRYAVMEQEETSDGHKYNVIVGYQNIDELMGLIQPFTFIANKSSDIPPKIYAAPRTVKMNDEQRRMYMELEEELNTEVEEGRIEPKNALEKMLKLRQIAAGFYTIPEVSVITQKSRSIAYPIPGPNPKVQALLDIVEESRGGVIVFCQYQWEVEAVAAALAEVYTWSQVAMFYGKTSGEDKTTIRHEFQAGEKRFIVATEASGGMSLTLTAAKLVVYYSNSFSWEDRKQSEDRAHRIGQKDQVTYIDIIAIGSVDRMILRALKLKKNVADFVKEALKQRRPDFS